VGPARLPDRVGRVGPVEAFSLARRWTCEHLAMSRPLPLDWLALRHEAPVDPDRPIVDPHHHLWPDGQGLAYAVDDVVSDTGAGHNIVKTVFVECHAAYDRDADPLFAPVGETRFVAESADDLARRHPDAAPIAGIVAHADLRSPRLDEVLDAHVAAGGGRFRGIRDALSCPIAPEELSVPGRAPSQLFEDPDFRAGVARLGELGFTYDSWHYHHQNGEFLALAHACPDTTMVLDHFGTPLGVGRFAGRHDEIFETWRDDVAAIAACENTVAKLGGLAMPDNGFGYHLGAEPPSSDQLLADQRRWYEHTIECFGPDRCMFESNFPMDKLSAPATVVWNMFQKLVADFTDDEQTALFSGTASRVYSL
jgi:predicted TIM-barrel fold metal-dependent hydrolase